MHSSCGIDRRASALSSAVDSSAFKECNVRHALSHATLPWPSQKPKGTRQEGEIGECECDTGNEMGSLISCVSILLTVYPHECIDLVGCGECERCDKWQFDIR